MLGLGPGVGLLEAAAQGHRFGLGGPEAPQDLGVALAQVAEGGGVVGQAGGQVLGGGGGGGGGNLCWNY